MIVAFYAYFLSPHLFAEACNLFPSPNRVVIEAVSSSSPSEMCTELLSLREALEVITDELTVRVRLAKDGDFTLPSWIFQTREITIEGDSSSITLTGLEVSEGSHLVFRHLFLAQESENGRITVRGELTISECVFQAWKSGIIEGLSGSIDILSSAFRDNIGKVVNVVNGRTDVWIRSSEFEGSSAAALEYHSIANEATQRSISVTDCSFRGNSGEGELVRIDITGDRYTVQMTGSEFVNNTINIVSANCKSSATITVDSCGFYNNSGIGFNIDFSSSLLVLQSVRWRGNSAPLVFSRRLNGKTMLSNCSLSDQVQIAPIQIENSGDATKCQVAITETNIYDVLIRPSRASASAIYSLSCSITLSKVQIRNCTILSPEMSLAYGALVGILSIFRISSTDLIESGGSGSSSLFLLSQLFAENITYQKSVIGADGVLMIVGTTGDLQRISFSEAQFASLLIRTRRRLVLMFLETSSVTIREMSVVDNAVFIVSVISSFYSVVRCDNVIYRNITGNSMIAAISSNIEALGVNITHCSYNLLLESVGSAVSFTRLFIADSAFAKGVAMSGSRSSVSVYGADLSNVAGNFFISAQFANVTMLEISIRNSTLGFLLRDLLRSSANLQKILYERVEGVLLSLSGSNVTISESRFVLIYGINTHLFDVSQSTVEIYGTFFQNISTKTLATVRKNSTLILSECEVISISPLSNKVISLLESDLRVSFSSFHQFNGTLFSCQSSHVLLTTSHIRAGGFLSYTENKSQLGGMMSCIDCAEVAVREVQVESVSADYGGAIYVTASETVTAVITIEDCLFEKCGAEDGGVLYIDNVALSIVDSVFLHSSAHSFGGAIFCSIRPSLPLVLSNLTFFSNSAYEGGAIKWMYSLPSNFTSLHFQNNTAMYGTDMATYAIGIQPENTSFLVPGQLANLTFSLIDHFGQRVTTASHQWLTLNPSPTLTFLGVSSKVVDDGFCDFSDISLLAAPGSTQILSLSAQDKHRDFSLSIHFSQNITFRHCLSGEIHRNTSCFHCPAGYFSFEPTDTDCRLCPENAVCHGGMNISANSGAWVTGNNQSVTVECILPEACLGNNVCLKGHSGELCIECTEGWFRLAFWTCAECPHIALFVFESFVVLAYSIILLSAVLKFALVVPDSFKLHIVKVVMSHCFQLSLLGYLPLHYPFHMQVFLRILLDCSSFFGVTLPANCLQYDYTYNIGFAACACIALLMAALGIVMIRCVKCHSLQPLHYDFSILFLFLCTQIPAIVAETALPSFVCVETGYASPSFLYTLSEACWGESHLAMISVSAPILGICVLGPIGAILWKIRSETYGKLTGEYTTAMWDAAAIAGKLISVLCVVLLVPFSVSSQLFTSLLLLYIQAFLSSSVTQYREERSLRLVQVSNFLLVASFSVLISFSQYSEPTWRSFVSTAIIALNSLFFLACVIRVCRGSRSREIYRIPQPRELSACDLVPPNNSQISVREISFEIK